MKKVFYSLMVAAGLVALTPVVLAASGSSGDGDVNIEAEGDDSPTDPEETPADSTDVEEPVVPGVVVFDEYDENDLETVFSEDFEGENPSNWVSPNGTVSLYVDEETGNHAARVDVNGSGNRTASYALDYGYALDGKTYWKLEFDGTTRQGNTADRSQSGFAIMGANSTQTNNDPTKTQNAYFYLLTDTYGAEGSANDDTWFVTVGEERGQAITLAKNTEYHYAFTLNGSKLRVTIANDEAVAIDAVYDVDLDAVGALQGIWTCLGRGAGYFLLDNVTLKTGTFTMDEGVYFEDFEGENPAAWTSPNGIVSLYVDEETGNHAARVDVNGSGNRTATFALNYGVALDGADNWKLEFDGTTRQGNTADRSQSAFAIMGANSTQTNNDPTKTENAYFYLLTDTYGAEGSADDDTWFLVVGGERVKAITLVKNTEYHYMFYLKGNQLHVKIANAESVAIDEYLQVDAESIGQLASIWTCLGRGAGYFLLDNVRISISQPAEVASAYFEDFEGEEPANWVSPNGTVSLYVDEATGNHAARVDVNGSGNRTATFTPNYGVALDGATNWTFEFDGTTRQGNTADRSQSAFAIMGANSTQTNNDPTKTENAYFYLLTDTYGAEGSADDDTWFLVVGGERVKAITLVKNTEYHYAFTLNGTTLHAKIANAENVAIDEDLTVDAEAIGQLASIWTCLGRGAGYFILDNVSITTVKKIQAVATPTIALEGETYTSSLVTLTNTDADDVTIYYTLDNQDTVVYTAPFVVFESAILTVWAEKPVEEKGETVMARSSDAKAEIVAGIIATPTASITKVYNEERTVTLADATPGVTIEYTANDETLTYSDPFVIDQTTSFTIVAKLADTHVPEHIYTSETLSVTYEAGTILSLNAPVFTVHQIEDSAKAVYFAEHNLVAYDVVANQSSVLCDPTASTTIDAYYVTPDYKDTIVLGTFATPAVIDSIPYGGVFAIAKAEGYATSVETHVYNKPALELTPVWEINFQDTIIKMANGAYYSSIGELVQGAVVTNLSNTDYVATTITGADSLGNAFTSPLDDRFAVQSGTSWLLRSMVDGRADYTGLYQYNGGWRSIALRNLKKRQVVKIVVAGGYDGSAFDAYGSIDETQGNMASMLELNVGESTPAQLVYTVKAEGDVNLYIHRYAYINAIGVYESNANVADPKFSIASVDENGTNVAIATETPDAFVYYRRTVKGELPADVDSADVLSSTKILDPDPTHTHMENHYLPQDSTWNENGYWDYKDWQIVQVEMRDSIIVGHYWTTWTKYTDLVAIQDTTVFEAYAWYQDVESDMVRDTIFTTYDIALTQPVIESVVGGVVTISADNSGLDLSVNVTKPTSTIWYQLPGSEPAIYSEPIELPAGTYGWMQAWAEAPGFETSTKAWRYLDSREAYNETYAWVVAETEAVPAAVTGDLELANVHELNAATTAVTPAGRIYLHKKVTKNFNSLVLPFAYNNTTTVTDAKGNVLERGVDFKIFNMTTAGSGNRTNDTSMETLLDALDEERTGNLTANTGAYLLQILNADLVGEDLIFVSTAGVSLSARNAPSYTEREEGWQIVVNNTLEPQTVGVKAYHLNETGTAYVLDENFVAAPLTSVIITEAAFADANPEIVLIEPEPTYLEITETLVFIPTEDAVADAVAAGWMEHGGTFTNNKTLTVNPETEEDEQTKSAPGLGIKAGNPAKSAAFYVTGADEVRSFATSTGSADRTMVVTATPNDGTDAVTAQATTSTTTAIIPLALDAAKSYKIEFASYDENGAGADMVIHAVKFVKTATGVESVVIENTDTDVIYDLAGRRVDTLVKGQIYIQNGKRFMVK